jgi:hypothetical protein
VKSELRPDGKLKHAPPMRRRGLEMAKPQVRPAPGCTSRSLMPLRGVKLALYQSDVLLRDLGQRHKLLPQSIEATV